jgi:hypothetical protein
MGNAVIIYTDTTSKEAVTDYMERQKRRRQREQERKRRRQYFIKQRIVGGSLIVIAALAAYVLDGDATIAIVTVPLGLYLIFGKEMLITNGYYYETKEREKQ